ncbi:MAG: hypothetical protein KAV00_12805, partial [Phycisphaerae bacterium]|nr:hypothetical protein [Phycisphaerae bacterium]
MGTNRPLRVLRTWAFAFVIVITCTTAALAGDTWWQHDPTETGLWFEPSNWTNGVPGGYYVNARIDNNGTALISSGDAAAWHLIIGYHNSGNLLQTGGTLDTVNTYMRLGHESGSTGTYTLTGGTLNAYGTKIGFHGNGVFEQTGGEAIFTGSYSDSDQWHVIGMHSGSYGVCRLSGGRQKIWPGLVIGFAEGSEGLFELSGTGELECNKITLGRYGTGSFIQTGGTVLIDNSSGNHYSNINVGLQPSGSGTYEFHAGEIQAYGIYVGGDTTGSGTFIQTGGTATLDLVDVGSTGRYVYTGGNVNFANRFVSRGEFDFDSSSATFAVPQGATLDLGQSILANASNASIQAQANTLVVFPSGFDPAIDLASYNSAGVTHIKGTTLVVPAGRGFTATTEIDDMIHCYGTISKPDAHGYSSRLMGGLKIFENGSVTLSSGGMVNVDNLESGMSGGELKGTGTWDGYLHVGHYGTGRFEQTAGSVRVIGLTLGYEPGSEGTYILSGDAALELRGACIGYQGIGRFIQNGGTITVGDNHLRVGFNGLYYSEGTYELHNGILDTYTIGIGVGYGTGHYLQTGGTLLTQGMSVGSETGDSSDCEITGGSLVSESLSVGCPAGASFVQRGGSIQIDRSLILGRGTYHNSNSAKGPGLYELIDGALATGSAYLGYEGHQGMFIQTGGSHQTGKLHIEPTGRYEYSAGQLSIGDLLVNDGEFDFMGSTTTFSAGTGGCWDFRLGNLMNVSNVSMTIGENTLAMFPAGFDPNVEFADYQCAGVTYIVGNTMVIPAGADIKYSEAEEDRSIDDHIECAGSLAPYGEWDDLYLTRGLHVQSGGSAQLGDDGILYVENLVSGITDGSLEADEEKIGYTGTGLFTQTGGTNTTEYLILGYEAGSSGTYIMQGDGQLVTRSIKVGCGGTGHFIQESGTVTSRGLGIKGEEESGDGLYEMRGGLLDIDSASIGEFGSGTIRQSGGVVVCDGNLNIGAWKPGPGTYELSDGQLTCGTLNVGYKGEGHFIQTGGVVTVTDIDSYDGLFLGKRTSGDAADGTYELIAGELSANYASIGYARIGTFIQTGG